MINHIKDLDIFFISYDEPNAEENYAKLSAISSRPVKRVHGVTGFHAAHRRCAEESETSRFVTIDGDNVVDPDLFYQSVDDADGRDLVFSFKARNIVNGLEYGNGGVKVWPKGLVLNVPTHEAATDAEAQTDFCWKYRYMQVDKLASYVHCNASPKQAFRAGYREAVKMTLVGGTKLPTWSETLATAWEGNIKRALIWATVGIDMPYGAWAIYGARNGLLDMWVYNHDAVELCSDYDAFDHYWDRNSFGGRSLGSEIAKAGHKLNLELGMGLVELDADQSRWFKAAYMNVPRSGLMLPDMKPVEFDD